MTLAIKTTVCLLAFIGAAAAQGTPTPLEPPPPAERRSIPGPKAPPSQFAPCVGIIDLKKRDACIERQTSKGNPAVPATDGGSDRKAPADPKAAPGK
jgi:hypothetical protein